MDGDSVGNLIDTLWQGRLVDPDLLRDLAGPAEAGAQATAAPALVADLVGRGVLTPFQAAECLAGRAGRLAPGPYRLLDLLGEGALGRVFRARHEPTGRTVAVKVLHAGALAGPAEVHRFHREAEAAARRLAHPKLVAVLDDGTHDGTHYLVMEEADGTPLRRFVDGTGPLEPAHACRLARQAALALQHAFERRLVPCDLTASAVMVADEGSTIQLLIAGQGWLGPSARGLGEFELGSLLQPGPEAWDEVSLDLEAAALRADARGALRGLGRVLRGMLSGSCDQETGPPIAGRDLEPGLAAVLARMEAADPRDGYASPAECAQDLAPFCDVAEDPEPIAPAVRPPLAVAPVPEPTAIARPESSPESTAPPPQPARRSLLAAAFVFLMGATTGAGATWVVWDHQARSLADARTAPRVSIPRLVASRDEVGSRPVPPSAPHAAEAPGPAVAVAVPQPADYVGLIERSERSLKQNRVDEAIARLDEAIRLKPDLAATYTLRAEAYASKQANEEVIADCNKAIAKAPGEPRAYLLRAAALAALGDDEGAVVDATRAIEHEPHDALAYNLRGASRFRLGQFRGAIDDLNEAVFLDEHVASAQGNLSRVYASAADPAFRNGALAVKHATRACELTAWNDPVHLDDLAAAYAESRQYERAVRLEAQALEHARQLPRSIIDCYQSRMDHYVALGSAPPPADPRDEETGGKRPPPPPVPAFRRLPAAGPPPAYRPGIVSRRGMWGGSPSRTIEFPRP